ncbi:MAG: lipopolysaccharide transport periplasmic protein LptA [Thermodesulfobacteriota bacterium]
MKTARRIGLLMIALSLFSFSMSGAQEKKATGKGEDKKPGMGIGFGLANSRAPIDITSDTAEGNQKQNVVTFKGNVVAKQEDTTLFANMLVIYYHPDTQKLKEMVASGGVKIVQLNRRATSQKATFYQEGNKIVLEGDVVVFDGENVVRGDRITYYIDEERSIVEGGKGGRVSTHITPTSKEK